VGGAQIRIQWVLDVVDRGVGAKVLAQDRLVRSSIAQTDAAVKKSGVESASVSARQAEGMARVAAAADKTGRAQINATGAGARYLSTQRDQIDISSKLVGEIDAVTAALNRQTEAAKRAGAEEAKRTAKVGRVGRSSGGGGLGSLVTGALGTGLKGVGLGVGAVAALAGGLTVSGLKKGTEIRSGAAGLGGLTGLNPKEATALAVIAQATSVSARGLGTAFATLGKQVVGLQKHEKEVAEARAAGKTPPKLSAAEEGFGKLGISGKQATSLQNNLPALFDLVYQRAQKLPAAQQVNVLKTFLGRGATLGGQVELAGPLVGQIKSVSGQLGGLDPKKLQALHETEIKLKEATTSLELGFAQTFGPSFLKLAALLAPAIKPFGDALRVIAKTIPVIALSPGIVEGIKDVVKGKPPPAAKGIQGDTANVVAGIGAGLLGRQVPTTAVRGAPSTRSLVSRLGAPLVGPRANKEPFALKPEKIKQEASGLAQVGEKVGGVLRLIGKTAGEAGQELLQAFKPAMPFVTNVVLPGLKLVGKYLELVAKVAIVANVIAFHVFVAVLKVAFTALGAIGIAAKATVGFFAKLGPAVAKVAVQVGGFFGALPGKLAGAASSAGHAVVGTLSGWIGKAGGVADSIAGAIVGGIASIPGRIGSVAGRILGTFEDLGSKIVGAIVGGIKGAISTVSEAFSELQPRFDVSVNPLHPHFHLFFGKTKVFRGGGMVDAMVSPGEQIVYGGSSMMVPGMPTAADSVMARLPVGAAVLTFDGQERIAQGASLGEALMSQRPHFQKGGEVVRGKVSTFGPPGEAAGSTASGASSSQAGVAIRPGETWQSGKPTLGRTWLIQIGGHTGPLQQIDLGPNQSTGRRIDVTGKGAKTLGIDPLNFPTDSEGTATLLGAGVKLPGGGKFVGSRGVTLPIMLAKSKTREGLLPEALKLGIEAGTAGLTAAEIGRANHGVRGAEGSTLVSTLAEKLGAVTRSLAAPSVAIPKGKTAKAGLITPSAAWNPARKQISAWIAPPLKWAAKMGWKGSVTSGYRSKAEQEYLYRNAGTKGISSIVAKPGTSNHEKINYPGGAVDVDGGSDAQLMGLLRRYPGTPKLVGGNLGPADPYHFSATGFRRGGIVGRIGRRLAFRAGGKVPPLATPISQGVAHLQATAGSKKFAGALSAFNEALDGLTVRGLEKYRALFVREARKPGSAVVIKSLQAAISSIDYALGLRIGNYYDQITKLGTAAERGQANLDRSLRKQGIDPASARGLGLIVGGDEAAAADHRGALAAAQKAVAIAKKTGNRTVIAEATEKLHAAQDELDEAVTKGIEDRRTMIRTAAQEASDAAGFGVSSAQNSLAGLDIAQRVNRSAETPGGLVQKASAIQAQLLPALEGSKAALERQLSVLQSSGASASELDAVIGQIQTTGNEVAGAMAEAAELIRQAAIKAAQELTEAAEFRLSSAQNALSGLDISQRLNQTAGTPGGELEKAQAIQAQILPAQQGLLAALNNQLGVLQAQGATPAEIDAAMLQIQTAASDIGNSMAEAAELIREAAEQSAAELVEAAGRGTSMAQLGEQKLELEQRLGGTYEAGASQRADYITSTLIPALDSELLALQTQMKVASEQGNAKLAAQIGEQIAGKQNDILQAQLEAMEDVASNTNQRKLGGVLGFSYGNEDLTDALVGVGSGA
jgi:D-alanyl-D-alanine carboxypeptidase